MLKQKCRNIFFLGRDRGVTGRFFAAIGGMQFCLFLRGLFLHKRNCTRSSLYVWVRAREEGGLHIAGGGAAYRPSDLA